jgi:hypothetical protein
MISRPEYVGDVTTLRPCSGDLLVCQQSNGHIVDWYLFKHEIDSSYCVDVVRLNFESFKTELIVDNYRVSQGCVQRIPRSRHDAFLAYGHHPLFKTPFEVREQVKFSRLQNPVHQTIYEKSVIECNELCERFGLDKHGRKIRKEDEK